MVDLIHNPPHYAGGHPVFPGEPLDYSKHMMFSQGNAFKYLWRYMFKGAAAQDLRKAAFYIEHMSTSDTVPFRDIPSTLASTLKSSFEEYTENNECTPNERMVWELMTMLAEPYDVHYPAWVTYSDALKEFANDFD